MLDIYKDLIASQFEAALCTLDICIDRCPDESWDAPVANLAFCQAVFHVLFFTDYYLGSEEQDLLQQPFHQQHKDYFRDYEELQPRKQELLYDRPTTKSYLQHCRSKAADVIAAETAELLNGPSGFKAREFSRAELHLYSIRHIQHHAAQLSLRLRLDHGVDVPWVGSGWRDA
jgi:hypothetical protein